MSRSIKLHTVIGVEQSSLNTQVVSCLIIAECRLALSMTIGGGDSLEDFHVHVADIEKIRLH